MPTPTAFKLSNLPQSQAQLRAPNGSLTSHRMDALSEEFESCECISSKELVLQKLGEPMLLSYLDMAVRNHAAGKILQHCKNKVDAFRRRIGANVCVFKIGFTSNPIFRFRKYQELNYSSMMLLHVTTCKGTAEMLEAALIDQHHSLVGCRNIQLGGEGPGHIRAEHYYVYIVGARADLPLPIG